MIVIIAPPRVGTDAGIMTHLLTRVTGGWGVNPEPGAPPDMSYFGVTLQLTMSIGGQLCRAAP